MVVYLQLVGGNGWKLLFTAGAGVLCLALIVFVWNGSGIQQTILAETLAETDFPLVRGDDEGAYFKEPKPGIEEYRDLTPEEQAKLHVEWERIENEPKAALEAQVAQGEEADKKLHDRSGMSIPEQSRDLGWWSDVHGEPLHTEVTRSYVSISGEKVPYTVSVPAAPCSLATSGCPTAPVQIYTTPEIDPRPQAWAARSHDTQLLEEEKRMSDEDKMEARLEKQGRAVRELRVLLARKHAKERLEAQKVLQEKNEDPLWRGVHLTAEDLQRPSKAQKKYERVMWHNFKAENERAEQSQATTKELLKAVQATAAARRGGNTGNEDRANQAEIGALWSSTWPLAWQNTPEDDDIYAPDGKRVEQQGAYSRIMHAAGLADRQRGAPASAVRQKRVRSGAASRRRSDNPFCKFCGGAEGGDKGGSFDGHKVWTEDDWKDAKKGSDFVRTFPDPHDPRVLDWLAADKDRYSSADDSMSSAGALVFFPKDWADFPQAKGTYTSFGIGPPYNHYHYQAI